MVETTIEFAVLSQGFWQNPSQKLWLETVLLAHTNFGLPEGNFGFIKFGCLE
jgi:hypothetical protein